MDNIFSFQNKKNKTLYVYIIAYAIGILVLLFPNKSFAQAKSLSFQEVQKLQEQTPQWHLVYIYTDWCKYCKAMEHTTFKNKKVEQLLGENLYFTKFNAEEREMISFAGQDFRYLPNGKNVGVHQLNFYLSNGTNAGIYPRMVLLSPTGEKVDFLEGFISAKDFIKVLQGLKSLQNTK